MKTANSLHNFDHNRGRFLGAAAMTVTFAQTGTFSSASAEPTQPEATKEEKPMTAAVALGEETIQ